MRQSGGKPSPRWSSPEVESYLAHFAAFMATPAGSHAEEEARVWLDVSLDHLIATKPPLPPALKDPR